MANKAYVQQETRLWFVPAGATQAEDAIFEADSLAAASGTPNTSGRASASLTLAAAPRSNLYFWEAFVQWATAPVVGEVVNVFIKQSLDDPAASDEAVDADDLRENWQWIGAIVVPDTSANTERRASGLIEITGRYLRVAFLNDSVDALTTDENENGLYMEPTPIEIQ